LFLLVDRVRESWIVGFREKVEKDNGKRQIEAASLAFSTRSNFLTIGGVSEDGQWSETKKGTPQGAVITPLTQKVISNLRE